MSTVTQHQNRQRNDCSSMKHHTLAAMPPTRTDLIKMPQSCRLRYTLVTLIPRLAKPDSPRAMWNVSLSLSSCWLLTAASSPLASTVDLTCDKPLQVDLSSLLSTLSSDTSAAAAAAGADTPLVGWNTSQQLLHYIRKNKLSHLNSNKSTASSKSFLHQPDSS